MIPIENRQHNRKQVRLLKAVINPFLDLDLGLNACFEEKCAHQINTEENYWSALFPFSGKSTEERRKRSFNGKRPLPVPEKYLRLNSRFDTVIAWGRGFTKGMKKVWSSQKEFQLLITSGIVLV